MLRIRRGEPSETTRAEAFSDGVFAVAITLLALDLNRIHASPDVPLLTSLRDQWPTLLAFAAAFAFIGIAWTNHHNVFVRVKGLSRSLNAANLLLLAAVTAVPWAASTLAEALPEVNTNLEAREAIVLYAAVTILGAFSWMLLYHVLSSSPHLLTDPHDAQGFAADRTGSWFGVATTAIAAAIGYYWAPVIGTMTFFLIPVVFAIASEGFEHSPSINGGVRSTKDSNAATG